MGPAVAYRAGACAKLQQMVNASFPADRPLIAGTGRRWLVIIGVWTGIAIFFCLQDALRFIVRGQPVPAWLLRAEVAYWWFWIALTPFALAAVRRFWITRPRLWRTIAIHCVIGLIIGLLHEVMVYGSVILTADTGMFGPAGEAPNLDWRRIPVGALTGFYKYWALIGVYSAFVYARRSRLQQIHAAQLETRLAQAELQALRMQLHPHFLFNTLHAVSMLNFSDVDAANRMLVRLSDLLRMSLEHSGKQYVSLREEIDFLRKYLEIEQTRFHDRLRVDFNIDETVLDAEVPNLILQPLVENAIRHGISRLAGPGIVEISAQRTADDLLLRVCDNGPGVTDDWALAEHAGIGLSTTTARLQQHYGVQQRFTLTRRPGGGTCAEVSLPYGSAFAEAE
ncbi:MAG TPA: sensor histidine kinase [Longimicrobiales bacterium]|nr:sensor histidine kinase [Longimicrobiales bacterium]